MRHVFRCDFCPEPLAGEFVLAADCAAHERGCEFNPAQRTCATCSRLEMDERCLRRKVRPLCTVFRDRLYRYQCVHWLSKPPVQTKAT